MKNSRYRNLLSVSLLLGQLLLTNAGARADELSADENLPEPLQGSISAKANLQPSLQGASSANRAIPMQATSHLLFGNVEQKANVALPASVNAAPPRLLRQTAKLAPTVDQMHRLSAQEENQAAFDNSTQSWFRIPPWLAGKWKIQDKQLVGEVNYRTGKQTPWRRLSFGYCGEQYGLQQDKNGKCWQFEKLGTQPGNYRLDKNGLAHFSVVETNRPLSSSDTQLVLLKKWSSVAMGPETQQVVDVKHFESTITFKRIDEDSIDIADATETFDRQGTALTMRWTQTTKVKVAPFEPVDNLHGSDVRSLFAAYMNHHANNGASF